MKLSYETAKGPKDRKMFIKVSKNKAKAKALAKAKK